MNDNEVTVKRYNETTVRKSIKGNNIIENSSTNSSNNLRNINKCTKKKIIIILSIVISIIVAAVVALIFLVFLKKPEDNNNNTNTDEIIIPKTEEPNKPIDEPFSVITPIYPDNYEKLESEFEFNTKVGDLKRIYVNQKYEENRLYDGLQISRTKERRTNYDIFIISESEPENGYTNYYNKMYTAAISIVNECISSENENCIPETLIDLTGPEIHNTRNLEEVDDLKDIPVPICLFNLTNNDVITSIKCPESLPDNKKKSIVLDLYFFRPPGIKRPNKDEVNVTITKQLKENNLFIRETNGGICDIENPIGSLCTTDMNTTTDKEGNILKYEEEANMFIETDDNNNYSKKKFTKLIDITNETKSLDSQQYNNTLHQLLPQLNPYFSYEELFSKENFEEILLVSKEGPEVLKKLRNRKNNRKLEGEDDTPRASIENTLLEHDGNVGIKLELGLVNNPGIGNEFMEGNSKLKIENNNKELTSSKKPSLSINDIINTLIALSESGNKLATQLYQNTNITMENMTEVINDGITHLNSLVKYKDLSDIFDATLSLDSINKLPYVIIEESTILKNKLEQLINSIENGGIKKNIKILNSNIYDYTEVSHTIINQLFDNLSDLGKALSSSKSKLTEISTYYLNNTCNSYLSTIESAEKILMNYYKDEYNLIKEKVDIILNNLENSISNSLQKQASIINSIYEKLYNRNYTIELANEEEFKLILNNLYYVKNYLNDIISKIKTKVTKEMDIKDNGYLMTNYDINSNNERSLDVINKAKEIANKLDNDEYIDKKFDEIMTHFRENFTNILEFMDNKKEENFPLNENVLNGEHFSSDVENNMINTLNQIGVDILNSIRRENDYYLSQKNQIINDFVKDNQNYLNNLTYQIDSKFTERNLEKIAELYDKAFKSCLEKTTTEFNNNYNSAYKYFNDLANIMQDDSQIIQLLRSYKSDRTTLLKYNPWKSLRSLEFEDTISTKYKTSGYLNKYRTFIENFANSKEFINNQIYSELLSEYKNTMFTLRQTLQNFKNNKLTDKYPDTSEFFFIDNNIKTIDNLYNRLNNKISDINFNNKYINLFDQSRTTLNNRLNVINNFIAQKHNIINSKEKKEDINYDFCLTFKRKISYTCVNGVVSVHTETDQYCFPVSNLNKNLVTHSIYTDQNYITFKNQFNEFYSTINNLVNSYTLKITKLKSDLLNSEKLAINQNYTLNYLNPIQSNINTLLSEKYGDVLIRKSYNVYYNNINNKIGPILNSISDKWKESFDILINEINSNINNFKNSIEEFGHMANIYDILIKNNATENYFNSIDSHQKNEFNYTITYYYNKLLKLVQSDYQYVINKIPNNRIGYNNILDKRKQEVINVFNNLINMIEKSEKNALNITQQTNVLQVTKTNFFKINNVLSTNKLETHNYLEGKISQLYEIVSPNPNDQFSLTAKFYLENQLSKLEIDKLYDQINRKVFVFLNLDKFKEILQDNWIFDQDQFIIELNNTLYSSNLQIEKEFSVQKEEYRNELEQYITHYFTKETLINKISDLYKFQIVNLSNNQVASINQNIQVILNRIKQYIADETNILLTSSTSYNSNFTRINNRINTFKSHIFKKLNDTIFIILETFYQNINQKLHREYVLAHINECESVSKSYTESYSDVDLLNSTFRIGNIIDDIIENILSELKNISKNQIDDIYFEKYNEIKDNVKLNDLEKLINDQINQEFNSKLLPALKKVATTNPGVTGYNEYDFNNTVLGDFDTLIESNMNKIRNIMDTAKGSNYNININSWEKDCSEIYKKVENIHNKFALFITEERKNEEDNFDEFLQNIIKNNFDTLLNNIVPSFGNQFFERILKYNENFKISSLYDYITYSLSQTITYYLFLHSPEMFSSLTKDLKLKLFSLNNLDATVKQKNNEVLQLLEEEVNKFITNSKEFLINKYKSYLISDLSIELSFNTIINDKISSNFNKVQLQIETDYLDLLNKYFKNHLIESYSKVMKAKTEEMVNTIKDQRESFKSKIDDYFTLEPDDVLNDINLKLNNTLDSIERYNNHFSMFAISNDIVQFLNKYGDNTIKPNYQNFINIANEATKDKINSTVERNSITYINSFNQDEFNEESNNIYSNIKNQYIENINNSIITYGIEDYPENLEAEINAYEDKKRRRRGRVLTDEEITNLMLERVADKAIDDTFKKLLTSSNNTKIFINALNKFDEFSTKIEENINNLNYAYKYSLNLIKSNNYEEEIHNILVQKLSDLKNMTLNYYNNISETFNILKNYLNNSINEIDNNLNKCANITYSVFADKYVNISKDVESFDSEDIKNEENEIKDTLNIPNQGKLINVTYKISNMTKKVQFKFDLIFEGEELKKPRVKVNVINQSKPDKISFNLVEPQSGCGKIVEILDVEFRDVNYTLNIDFFTNSTDLYLTTIGDFESYYKYKELQEIQEEIKSKCVVVLGNQVCSQVTICNEIPLILSNRTNELVPRKKINDVSRIHMN